jgi:4'-phosphopantetheinyl transferase
MQELAGIMSVDERDRADAFINLDAKMTFIMARSVMRLMLSRYLGGSPRTIQLSIGAYGRPQLAQSGTGIDFNISHSGNIAFLGITNVGSIGVDIEQKRTIDLQAFVNFLTVEERTAIDRYGPDLQSSRFFEVWTRLEAYSKMLGVGLDASLEERSYTPTANGCEYLLNGTKTCIQTLDVARNYCAAVATTKPVKLSRSKSDQDKLYTLAKHSAIDLSSSSIACFSSTGEINRQGESFI